MKNILHKISKILSTIVFWILIVIIIVLLGYVIVIKVLEKQGKISEVPINFYTILSQSMYPTIEAGDIIVTYSKDDNQYEVGDIITFVSNIDITNGITITHRIIESTTSNGEHFYTTKGDNNATPDSTPVSSNNVIGAYLFKIPKAGFVQQFLVGKFGWIVAIVIPSVGIIIYDIVKIFKKSSLKNLKKPNKKQKIKVEINDKAKDELSEVLNGNNISKDVEQQIDNLYDNVGIKVDDNASKSSVANETENLYEEVTQVKEEEDETEIL